MKGTDPIQRVSIHGGHSGEFCGHARDRLEQVVAAYIERGFAWFGITEHMPPAQERFRYPEERKAGLHASQLRERFGRYMTCARRLQKAFGDRLQIYVGFETEAYSGALALARRLCAEYRPDYIVGSVHHVNDIGFDLSAAAYAAAVRAAGGIEALYCDYFDTQYTMIETLRPEVVGHFDLVRIFDPDYRRRLGRPEIRRRVQRNLHLIQSYDLILDYNARALSKGAQEPYLCQPLLEAALAEKIAVVPGDDSHGVASVGADIDRAIGILAQAGADLNWRKPAPRRAETSPQ